VRVCQFRHSGSGQKPYFNRSVRLQQPAGTVSPVRRFRSGRGLLPALAAVVALAALDGAASAWLARCGLQANYFSSPELAGVPVAAALESGPSTALLKRRWGRLPRPFGAAWQGVLWVDRPATRSFSLVSGGRARLEVDGRTVLQATATGGLRQYSAAWPLEAGAHPIRLQYSMLGPGNDPHLELAWQEGDGPPRRLPRQALSPEAPSASQRRGRRLAGVASLAARPLWTAGLAGLLAWLLARTAGGWGTPGLRLGVALLAISVALVLGEAPSLLWPDVEVQQGRLVLALLLHALLAWLVLRALPALAGAGWGTALLGGVSLLGALGAGEIMLRTLRPDDAMPRFRWVASSRYHHANPPALRMFAGRVAGAPVIVATNEDGLRSPHSRRDFTAHRTRILVLGDSFAFGPGVAGEEAFPAQLERRLAARSGPGGLAVLNAGVIGYSPLLEKLQFADLAERYRPTLVLLLLDATDIGDDDAYGRLARQGPSGTRFDTEGETRLVYRGAVHEVLRPVLRWARELLAYPWALAGEALGLRQDANSAGFNYYVLPMEVEGQLDNRFFHYRHPPEVTRPFFEATLRHVREIAGRARAGQARFALVVSPRYHHWSRREAPQNWEQGTYGTDEPFQHEYLRFFGGQGPELGFPALDLLPAFQATGRFPLVFPNDPHWNAQGHAFVAETVADYLVREGLLEP
jgi:lysophospholipase L1-like esterase